MKLDTSMSFRATGLRRSFGVILLGAWAASVPVFAQMAKPPVAQLTSARVAQDQAGQAPLRIINFVNEEAITTSFVQAPAIVSTTSSSGELGNWLKVEFHYSVNPEHPDRYPFVDAADFKVWIEGRDLYAANAPAGSREGVAVCLTGSVTYVNLAQARDAYGVFYVHPSALARYCGAGTYEDFDRKFDVHIEADVVGKPVDVIDKNKETDPGWYTKPAPVANLVFRQDQSPFVLTDVPHYPQIKLQASGQ